MARQLPPNEEWLLDEFYPVRLLPEIVMPPLLVPDEEPPTERVNRD